MTTPILTRQQVEVLRLIADGRCNKEIAAALFVEENTVKTHVLLMRRRLGARDRGHAVSLGYKYGILDPRDGAQPDPIEARATTSAVVDLGVLALKFARVNRITYHEDGLTPESDTDHTVMLGLIACAFAEKHLPGLNLGLVAQFALVHDLVEVYAGDTPTLRINSDQQASKQEREQAAYERLNKEFVQALPWVPEMIDLYEQRSTPEARYVKAMDKLLPKITHLANGGKTLQQQGMTLAQLQQRYVQQYSELQAYASDFPALFELRDELLAMVYAKLDRTEWAVLAPGIQPIPHRSRQAAQYTLSKIHNGRLVRRRFLEREWQPDEAADRG